MRRVGLIIALASFGVGYYFGDKTARIAMSQQIGRITAEFDFEGMISKMQAQSNNFGQGADC